jgi:antitoxin component of MazEF toxin-antitoxin module
MHKRLTPIGDGLGLVIDPLILDQLHINADTQLEVTVENKGIVIRAIEDDVQTDFVESARRMMEIHRGTFRRLAE